MIVASPSTLAHSGMTTQPVERRVTESLVELGLTGRVADPRPTFHVAWVAVMAASVLAAIFAVRLALPDYSWQTEALAFHRQVGIDKHAEVWNQVQTVARSHDNEISLVPLLQQMNILSSEDKVGVDPRLLASLLEKAYPDLANTDSTIACLATSNTNVPTDFEAAAVHLASDNYPLQSERDAILQALANAIGVDRTTLGIRMQPTCDLSDGGKRELLYDGKVFDHVGQEGQSLWQSLLTPDEAAELSVTPPASSHQLEDLIKKRPAEATFFTRLIRWNEPVSDNQRQIAFELNTSGFGVVPVLEPNDKVTVFLKSMKHSQWRPLQSIPNLDEVGLTITTIVQRPIDVAGRGPHSIHLRAVYVNAFQDQFVRRLIDPEIDSDWWGARIQHGTARGDLAVGFPASLNFGPQGGDDIKPEIGFKANESESPTYDPIEKQMFPLGARNWIIPDRFVAGKYWEDHPDTTAAVIRFRARCKPIAEQ